MAFKVLQSGLFTTIQDTGRKGVAHKGHSQSGALDRYAYKQSLALLHESDTNALEVMVGLKLEAIKPTTIAITGADLGLKINGIFKKPWQSYTIKKGDILYFAKRIQGQRAYLTVKGGFDVPKVLGSYATMLKEGIGSTLKAGDIINYMPYLHKQTNRLKKEHIPYYGDTLTLRVQLCYQHHYFSDTEKKKFFNNEYKVTLQSDRMGYRLSGESIVPSSTKLISEGIAFGSVQIPKDGQPIILLAQRQSIGGYPKIGTVLAKDCYTLAQMGAGSSIFFEMYLDKN